MAFGFVGDIAKKAASVPLQAGKALAKPAIDFLRGGAKDVKDIFKGIPTPGIPEVDPRLKGMASKQLQLADQFKQGLPGLRERQFNVGADKLRMGLAGKMADIRRGASSRGLLYSGIPQGQQAQARTQLGTQFGQLRGDIQQRTQKQLQDMQDRAFKSNIEIQRLEQERAKALYNQALAKAQARTAAMMGLGRGGGGLLGGLMGG